MLNFGTCSWNYPSWLGLVYDWPQDRAADYLPDYARHFGTVEIDSWFYQIPSPRDAKAYAEAVPDTFRFTVKAWRGLTGPGRPEAPNPDFLNPDSLARFLDAGAALWPKTDFVMLEFGYLNRQLWPGGPQAFLEALDRFSAQVRARLGALPVQLAVEGRNGPWLDRAWFRALQAAGLAPVLSQRQYLPPVQTLAPLRDLWPRSFVLRLLGEDRAGMEERTGERWDQIVAPAPDLPSLAGFLKTLDTEGFEVTVNVNNHWEGCSPRSIARLRAALEGAAPAGPGPGP